ncbi:MAG: DUF6049 family protein [Flaviflexus sp.]|nr:DUF6049 family protein [Flaviflexus sp.]
MRKWAALAAALALLAPSSALAEPVDPGSVDAEITGFSSAIHTPGESLTVSVDLSSTAKRERVELALLVQTEVPRSRSSLTAWMAGVDSSATYVLRQREVELSRGDSRVDIDIPAESLRWGYSATTWGPRGIELQVRSAGEVLASDRSVMVIEPSYDISPMDYTTILPLTTARDDLAELAPVDELYRERISSENPPTDPISPLAYPAARAAARGARVLPKLTAPGLTLALDSALTAPDLGTVDDLSQDLVAFADQRAHEVLLLPSFDPDLAACSRIDSPLLAPHLLRRDEAQAALEEKGIRARTDVLVPAAPLTRGVATEGAKADSSLLIAHSDELPLVEQQYWTPSARTRLDGMDAIIVDDTLSGILTGQIPRTVISDPVPLNDLDRRQLLLGMSAVHYRERPNDPRPLALMIPRERTPDSPSVAPDQLNDLLGELSKARWLRPTTLSTIASSRPDEAARLALPEGQAAPGELTGELASATSLAAAQVTAVGRLTPHPERYAQLGDAVLETLPALAWRTAPKARANYARGLTELARELGGAISAQESSTINLISQDSALPVHVNSSLDEPAEVTISLHSADRRLRFDDVQVRLDPQGTTTAMVPVQAIGSGNVTATIAVTDANGVPIGEDAEITIRVRADWENMGTAALAVVFLLIFIIGIIRSARRGTRTQPVDPGSPLDLASRSVRRRGGGTDPHAEVD